MTLDPRKVSALRQAAIHWIQRMRDPVAPQEMVFQTAVERSRGLSERRPEPFLIDRARTEGGRRGTGETAV
jgi:hypothetical protein